VTGSWLLLAAALALAGGARTRVSVRGPVPPRALRWMTALGVAAGCLAGFGSGRGAALAAVAVPVAVFAVGRLDGRPPRVQPAPSLALALDLVALALRAGQPLAAALMVAAPAAEGRCLEHLMQVGGLLRLGADPAEAWRVAADDPVLAPVAAAAVRSAASGVRLAGAFEQLAAEVRARLRAAAEARAHRAGVLAAAPLGLCFLPSFVCLGIVPTVVGIASGVLAGA
jgi:Flp pilus assembly protein TadB